MDERTCEQNGERDHALREHHHEHQRVGGPGVLAALAQLQLRLLAPPEELAVQLQPRVGPQGVEAGGVEVAGGGADESVWKRRRRILC